MLSVIRGGRVVDPTASRDSVGDVWIEDGQIIDPPGREADAVIDAAGCVVMAAASRCIRTSRAAT